MRSIKSLKGFKKDKRNLLDSSSNLIVFGEGQRSEDASKHRRRLRSETSAFCGVNISGSRISKFGVSPRSASRRLSTQPLVPGPGSAMRRLDQLTHFDVMSNYFQDTRPWNQSSMRVSGEFTDKEKQEILGSNLPFPRTQSRNGSLSTTGSQRLQQQLAGNTDDVFVQAHVCPICFEGFEPIRSKIIPAADIMRVSMQMYQQKSSIMFRKNLEDGWGQPSKPKKTLKPQEVVVSANCGELFHKVCLRDWCSQVHKTSGNKLKPMITCPSCKKELKYTSCQEVEINRNFSGEPTAIERKLIQTKAVNKELQVLWPESNNYLSKLHNDIKEAETIHKELKSKRRHVKSQLKKLTPEDLSIVMSKVTDPASMKTMLEKQEKALEFMQQETLQIMRMYLLTVLRKRNNTASILQSAAKDLKACPNTTNNEGSKNTSRNSTQTQSLLAVVGGTGETIQVQNSPTFGIIPVSLVPHLQTIMNDDHSLHLLSRILVPMPEDSGEAKLKLLELEILQKHDPDQATRLTRTNTYTVLSSAAEVGETESESKTIKQKNSADAAVLGNNGSSHSTLVSANDSENAVNLVKAVSALHRFPTDQISCIDLLLKPKIFSNQSMQTQKPSKLFDIQEVSDMESDLVTINSSAELVKILHGPRENREKEFVNGKTKDEIKVVHDQNKAGFQEEEEEEEKNEKFKERMAFVSPLSHYPLAPSYRPKYWLELKPQDSRVPSSLEVSAISLKSKLMAEHQHPNTANSAVETEKISQVQLEKIQEIINNSLTKIGSPASATPNSNKPSSINRLTKSLSDTKLNACLTLRRSLELLSAQAGVDKDLLQLMIKSFDANQDDNTREKVEEVESISEEAPAQFRNDQEEDSDSCWSTIASEDEDEENKTKQLATILEESHDFPNNIEEMQPTSTPRLPTHHSSCQLVFSTAEKKKKLRKGSNNDGYSNTKRRITMCRGQVPRHSDTSLTSIPDKQLSIAIMYIIDDDGDEVEEEERTKHSQNNSETALNHVYPPAPPTPFKDDNDNMNATSSSAKLINPVFMDAERTSDYSNLADQVSSETSASSENGMILDLSQLHTTKQVLPELPPEVKLSGCGQTRLEKQMYHPTPLEVSSWTHGFGGARSRGLVEDRLHRQPQPTTPYSSLLMRPSQTNNNPIHENNYNPNGILMQKTSLPHVNSLTYINKTHMFYENEVAINKSSRLLNNSGRNINIPFQ